MQKDGPYVGFHSVDFGVNSDISIGEDGLHLGVNLLQTKLFFLPLSHLPSGFIVKLESCQLFFYFPLYKMLRTGMSDYFEVNS